MSKKGTSFRPEDLKKWGFFCGFLVLLMVAYFALKPGGESSAKNTVAQAGQLYQEALTIAQSTRAPKDLANVELAGDSLRNAQSLLVESDFEQAAVEADKAVQFANEVIHRQRDLGPVIKTDFRITEAAGDVILRRAGTQDAVSVASNSYLALNDELEVGRNAGARLLTNNRTLIDIMPNSTFRLTRSDGPDEDGDLHLNLLLSRGRLEISTDDALAGEKIFFNKGDVSVRVYRNTRGSIDNSGINLKLRVSHGRMEVGADRLVANLSKNQMLVVKPNESLGQPVSVPPGPKLKSPSNLARYETNQKGFFPLTLEWDTGADAILYDIEVARDPVFAHLVEQKSGFAGQGVIFTFEPGTYFWRVYSTNSKYETGMPSKPRQFQVIAYTGARNLDATPPPLSIVDTTVQGGVVIVQGRTEKDATVIVNDERAIVNQADGSFNYTASFPGEGVYDINVVSIDRAGNRSFEEFKVKIRE